MASGPPLQAFTAIGKILSDFIYEFPMTPEFVPYRREIYYVKRVKSAPIKDLIERLSFVKDPKHWGYPFRRGHFEISKIDFLLIAKSMGVRRYG